MEGLFLDWSMNNSSKLIEVKYKQGYKVHRVTTMVGTRRNSFLTADGFYFLNDLECKIVRENEQGRETVEALRKEKEICRSHF